MVEKRFFLEEKPIAAKIGSQDTFGCFGGGLIVKIPFLLESRNKTFEKNKESWELTFRNP